MDDLLKNTFSGAIATICDADFNKEIPTLRTITVQTMEDFYEYCKE